MRREWWAGILRLQKETKIPSLRLDLGRIFHHNLTLWLTVLLLSAYFPALVFWHAGFMQLKTRGGMMECRWSRAKRRFFSRWVFRASLIPLLLNGSGVFFKWVFKESPLQITILVRLTQQLKLQSADHKIRAVNSSLPPCPQKEISCSGKIFFMTS